MISGKKGRIFWCLTGCIIICCFSRSSMAESQIEKSIPDTLIQEAGDLSARPKSPPKITKRHWHCCSVDQALACNLAISMDDGSSPSCSISNISLCNYAWITVKMAYVFGSLPFMWKNQKGFWPPGCSPAIAAIWEVNLWMRSFYLCISLCISSIAATLPFKQIALAQLHPLISCQLSQDVCSGIDFPCMSYLILSNCLSHMHLQFLSHWKCQGLSFLLSI